METDTTLDATLDRIDQHFNTLLGRLRSAERQRDRALAILKELEDYCGERAEGGYGDDGTQGNDWNTAWLITQSYADGPVPYSYRKPKEETHGD